MPTRPRVAATGSEARELARRILVVLDAERLAARFIEDYAARYGRKELVIHLERNRELRGLLEREMLLAMLARMARELEPARSGLGARWLSKTAAPDRFLCRVLEAIGRERHWTAGDLVELWGELNRYRAALSASGGRRTITGPFVDRCAFLLDPSMMENARVASAKVLRQLEVLALQLLGPQP